eukprot:CAMPEP_0113397734 /NCGR_PEP_ID=MMETSP0013_2-20120614/14553_1 /TAXON_ID=2843 ORGANISM="Skeletonema costatum, Strain 1716" /NCGR_SAMPLE_ID=MMETSP0013_2 /ASSEMBLY_ACC=CAM_ASM_000158 /LENGTH=504 /DNA_ID=CAMNT_0000282367 /DNA_START=19 /DNA_END=1533 /DNA_ORIENTATION=+ /assembly_acc=CAM_ASM_000158
MPPSAKRPRSKFKVDLSGHGGRYEDVVDDMKPSRKNDEDIESDEDDDDDDDLNNVGHSGDDSEDSEEEETAESKRLRMAREYLDKLEAQESSSEGESDSDNGASDDDEDGAPVDKVGKRIAKERLRKSGLLQSRIADSVLEGIQSLQSSIADSSQDKSAEACAKLWINAKYVTYLRGHDLTPTCVSLSQQGTKAFSGAKDGSVIMWNVQDGTKTTILPAIKDQYAANLSDRNEREILAIATSDDDRYLAIGGRDNCVRIFDTRTLGKSTSSPLTTMEGHKKPVTTLAFRSRSLDLYSGSEDRCIRRYDLNAMTYVETLYGHQSPIVAIDCANKNRPVSIARDRTVRVWKVEEDSHLVYRGGGDVGSAECITAIQDGWFVTGHDDGRLLLWKEEKKRPVGDVIKAAHGQENGVARSVISCGALGLSDVLATGSSDGYLRLWKVNTDGKDAGITPLESIPVHGYINSIVMGPEGKFCVVAVGQEPRLGRWDRVARAKNRVAIIRLK